MLTNEKATRTAVAAALDRLAAQATRADTTVVFLAGHGWRGGPREFYFATSEVQPKNVRGTALGWSGVVARLARLAQRCRRVLVLLDACHSGSAATNEELAKGVLQANAGLMLFCSSRGSEVSLESAAVRHGYFTQAVLEALADQPGGGGSRDVTLWDFVGYVRSRVKELSDGMQNPQLPFWQDWDLDAAIVRRR